MLRVCARPSLNWAHSNFLSGLSRLSQLAASAAWVTLRGLVKGLNPELLICQPGGPLVAVPWSLLCGRVTYLADARGRRVVGHDV